MGTPQIPLVDSDSKQLPDGVRQRQAANIADPSTPEGAAVIGVLPRSEAVRITAAKLPVWTKKRQLAALNQSPARVLCVGDSTTAGVYSDSYTTATGSTNQGGPNSYPSRLAAFLTARGVPAAVGMAIPGHPGNDDSRWGGPYAYAGGNIGAGAAAAFTFTNSSQAATLTPGVKADTYIIYWYGDSGTGTFTAQVGNEAATSINTVKSTAGVYKTTIKSASAASAANVLSFYWSSGTSFMLAVEWFDSANPNIVRILPAGVGGSQANQWANQSATNQYGGRAFIKAVAPDLTVFSLGINDAAAGRSGTQVLTDVTTLANDAANSGDVMLMSGFPHPQATSLDAVNSAYFGSSFPYVDLAWRYGYNMVTWGLMTNDGTHPNALGYSDAASVLARHL